MFSTRFPCDRFHMKFLLVTFFFLNYSVDIMCVTANSLVVVNRLR